MKRIIHIITFSVVLYSCTNDKAQKISESAPSFTVDWDYADSIKEDIREPIIPTDTFQLVLLVKHSSQNQIQEAIDIVSKRGGGTLILPKGKYYSGPITLKSKVELYLEEGAVLKFIADPELYPLKYTWFNGIPCMNYSSMIYARDETDIKISGKGIIDGQGNSPAWRNMKYYEKIDKDLLKELDEEKINIENRKFGKGHFLRPDFIAFYECSKVSVSGVTILNSPRFTFHPVMCNHITIKNSFLKSKGYEQIGIAIESSQNILIDSMQLEDIGEGIKIFSGSVDILNNKASGNILIQNSVFRNISHTPIIFSSKSLYGIKRVFISGLQFDNSEAGICIYGKQNVKIHDILIKNIDSKNISGSFFYAKILRTRNNSPIIYNIQLDSIRVNECGRAFFIKGHLKNPIQNLNISNTVFNVSKGSFAKHVKNLNFNNVEIMGETISKNLNIGENRIPKINLNNSEDEILDSDDIQYNDLPLAVKTTIEEIYPFIPITDIDRIITSSNVIYEIDLELHSFQEIEILVQIDGEILRSEYNSNFTGLPEKVLFALEQYLGARPTPFLFNEIKEIHYKDFTYYKIKGEYNQKLFAIGISTDGKVIEEKQQTITSYFSFN
jgi:polygalacturonase